MLSEKIRILVVFFNVGKPKSLKEIFMSKFSKLSLQTSSSDAEIQST